MTASGRKWMRTPVRGRKWTLRGYVITHPNIWQGAPLMVSREGALCVSGNARLFSRRAECYAAIKRHVEFWQRWAKLRPKHKLQEYERGLGFRITLVKGVQ